MRTNTFNSTGILPMLAAGLLLSAMGESCDCGSTKETGDTAQACDVEVDGSYPTDGATDFYYRADVEFYLSDADTDGSPTIVLEGPSGEVSGTTSYSEDMETVYFTPDDYLNASTSYTATLTFCGGEPSVSFTTSDLGTDLTEDLVGKTYLVELGSARIVEPAAVAGLLAQYEDEIPGILIGVMAVEGDTITMWASS